MQRARASKLSSIEAVILDLLRSREMYGLELVDESDGFLKRGTVYVTLGRMEEKGFVAWRTDAEATHPGMPRRLYRATPLGAKVLEAWSMVAAHLSRSPRHA